MAGTGGARPGAGRKRKADEQKLVESLSIYDDLVLEKLMEGVKKGNHKLIELFLAYRFGKPRQQVDITTNDESVNRVLTIPEVIATRLLNDVPEQQGQPQSDDYQNIIE